MRSQRASLPEFTEEVKTVNPAVPTLVSERSKLHLIFQHQFAPYLDGE